MNNYLSVVFGGEAIGLNKFCIWCCRSLGGQFCGQFLAWPACRSYDRSPCLLLGGVKLISFSVESFAAKLGLQPQIFICLISSLLLPSCAIAWVFHRALPKQSSLDNLFSTELNLNIDGLHLASCIFQ